MPELLSQVWADDRPIAAIWWAGNRYDVGVCGVTKIDVCMEPGPHGPLPWFQVHLGGEVGHRCPAHNVEGVTYALPRGTPF